MSDDSNAFREVKVDAPPLLVISPGGLGRHYHGPAISMYRLLSTLAGDISVDVIHGYPEQGDIAPLRGRAIRTGTATQNFRSSFSYVLRASLFVLRNHRRYDSVLLVAMNLLTLIPGAIARACGMRVIARAAAIAEVSTQSGGWMGRAVKLALIRRASEFLAISEAIAEALREVTQNAIPIRHIPNSVDIVRFHPVSKDQAEAAAAALGLRPTKCIRLVCVGAAGKRKGTQHVLDAMAMLPDDVTLLLAGPVREPEFGVELAARLRDPATACRVDHIAFLEHVERAYACGDIFLLPSDGEGMPNAMLEAMASGLVPIGTKVSGIEDLIEPGCGQFVERDAASIVNAVCSYLDDEKKLAREKLRAREKIEAAYNSADMADRLLSVLRGDKMATQT